MADLDKLYAQLDNCERLSTPDELISIGEIVCDYLKMLYEKEGYAAYGLPQAIGQPPL